MVLVADSPPTYVLKEILSRGTLKDVTDAAWYLVGALPSDNQHRALLDFGEDTQHGERFATENVRFLHPYASVEYCLLIRTQLVSLSNGSVRTKYLLQRYAMQDELSRLYASDLTSLSRRA